MDGTAESWIQWAEGSLLANTIRQSTWMYPSLEIIHIIGIAMLVGAALMFDLRLLGFSKTLSVSELGDHLLTWSRRGLWLIFPSGILLFFTNAEALSADPVFWAKMTLLLFGGSNALFFHRRVHRSQSGWDKNIPAPALAKVNACISILVWMGVIICGRLLAY